MSVSEGRGVHNPNFSRAFRVLLLVALSWILVFMATACGNCIEDYKGCEDDDQCCSGYCTMYKGLGTNECRPKK